MNALKGKEQESHEYLFWRFQKKEAVREGRWKAVRLDPKKPTELYDLESDLGEKNDVAKKHPELVKRLETLMAKAVK